jgi:hypothetical protein
MAHRNGSQPQLEVPDLRPEPQELTPEASEAVEGGTITARIGLRGDPTPTMQLNREIVTGAGAGPTPH